MATYQSDRLREQLDSLLVLVAEAESAVTAGLSGLDLEEAVEVAENIEAVARRLYRLQVLAAGAVEAESPRKRGSAGMQSPFRRGSDILRSRCRISGAEARRRIRAAEALLPGRTLTGQEIDPVHEHLAQLFTGVGVGALEPDLSEPDLSEADQPPDQPPDQPVVGPSSGSVGGESVEVVLRVLEEARSFATPEELIEADRLLSDHAQEFDPDTMRRLGRVLLTRLDPDGREPTESDLASRQGVRVGARWRGLLHLDIWADATQAETLLTVFDTATNPRLTPAAGAEGASAPSTRQPGETSESPGAIHEGGPLDGPGAADSPQAGHAPGAGHAPRLGNASDGVATLGEPVALGSAEAVPERRTLAQRRLDGLVAACQAALRVGELSSIGGLPPQVMVTISLNDLANDPRVREAVGADHPPDTRAGPSGSAGLARQGPVPVATVRRLGCDADIVPVVLNTAGDVVDLGRANRLVSPAMRKALIARDRGCLAPGCTIPATWTEAHHVVPWAAGGDTSIANSVLLCSYHHHAVHAGRLVIRRAGQGENDQSSPLLRVTSPYRVSTPWAALPGLTHNAYHLAT